MLVYLQLHKARQWYGVKEWGELEGWYYKDTGGSLESYKYVHYLDCGNEFMSIYIDQNLFNFLPYVYVVDCISVIPL